MSYEKFKCLKHLEVRGVPMIDLQKGFYACAHCISNSDNPIDYRNYMLAPQMIQQEVEGWTAMFDQADRLELQCENLMSHIGKDPKKKIQILDLIKQIRSYSLEQVKKVSDEKKALDVYSLFKIREGIQIQIDQVLEITSSIRMQNIDKSDPAFISVEHSLHERNSSNALASMSKINRLQKEPLSDNSPSRAVENLKAAIDQDSIASQEPYKTKEGTIEERIEYVREKLSSPPFRRNNRSKSKEKALSITVQEKQEEVKERIKKNTFVSKLESPKDKLRNSPVDWNTVEVLKKRITALETEGHKKEEEKKAKDTRIEDLEKRLDEHEATIKAMSQNLEKLTQLVMKATSNTLKKKEASPEAKEIQPPPQKVPNQKQQLSKSPIRGKQDPVKLLKK